MYIRAVYMRENKPQLTLAEANIRHERNHLYEYSLHKMQTAGINGSQLRSQIRSRERRLGTIILYGVFASYVSRGLFSLI